jgi:two-component system cell cycle sensor histidine kinase/response regulator CckA
VEDEDSVRKLARISLEGAGYSVTEAPDGETACELLGSAPQIDLLVTDLTMPGIGGRELALQVRAGRPEIGVVFISGYATDIGRLDSIPRAVFLAKPFAPGDIVRASAKAIDRAEGTSLPSV